MASKYEGSFDALMRTDPENHLVVSTDEEAKGIRQFYYRKSQLMYQGLRSVGMLVSARKCILRQRANGWHLWLETEKVPDYTIVNQKEEAGTLQPPESSK
jgi:hypothetical protein